MVPASDEQYRNFSITYEQLLLFSNISYFRSCDQMTRIVLLQEQKKSEGCYKMLQNPLGLNLMGIWRVLDNLKNKFFLSCVGIIY